MTETTNLHCKSLKKNNPGQPGLSIIVMTNEILQKLQSKRYNPKHTPKPEQVLFTIQNKVIGTVQNYIVFSGQPKAGKSSFLTSAIASAFLPSFQDCFGMKMQPPNERSRVAFFDTESSEFDFYRVIDRIKHFAMRDNLPNTFDAFSMREDSPGAIRKMIVAYLEANPDCSIVVVDGFLDLCLNYNDEVETRLLTNWFKKITKKYEVLLVGVLHLSKGAGNTIGHLGSNTDRWAQSTMIVEKDDTTRQFVLKPKFLRSADTFEPIALMNFNGQWQQMAYEQPAVFEIKKPGKKPGS